ncbi:hypothetical protein HMPREF3034_01473 [Prevotella sp. DNF00663]|nr:hypothetical protein HMPREF3034_01473 [Prevotella sp. DNF00663]
MKSDELKVFALKDNERRFQDGIAFIVIPYIKSLIFQCFRTHLSMFFVTLHSHHYNE